MASDTRQICARRAESTVRVDAEGFELSLRAWELDVGEWERATGTALADAVKYTVMMSMAPILLRNSLHLGTFPNSAALRAALLQWCYSSRNFGANPTVSAGNVTSADDDRMQVGSLKKSKGKGKGKHQNQKGIARPARPTRALQTSTCARTAGELDIGRRTAGDQVEEHTTIPPVTTPTRTKAILIFFIFYVLFSDVFLFFFHCLFQKKKTLFFHSWKNIVEKFFL